jgi:RNA polymerase sigma-70 factor (ECF subfamily)
LNNCRTNDEARLLLSLSAGDADAFRALYEQYRAALYGFLYNLTKSHAVSEDLLQDTFLRIWEDRVNITLVRDFKAYLFTMVKHRALNALKRVGREELAMREIAQRLSERESSPTESEVQYHELQRNLDKVVRGLPPQQQSVYRMSREQGLRQDEISYRLNVTVATVKKHLNLSLRYIRKNLQ